MFIYRGFHHKYYLFRIRHFRHNNITLIRFTFSPFQGCGKTLQENNGIFGYSPVPGQEYGERCEWRITATHGERIVLNITELDILKSDQCGSDYLEIRDGYWHKSPLLGNKKKY